MNMFIQGVFLGVMQAACRLHAACMQRVAPGLHGVAPGMQGVDPVIYTVLSYGDDHT